MLDSTRSKLLILLQVALLLIMSVDSTTETDLRGLHFNIIAFQVSRIHLNMNHMNLKY